MYQGALKPPDVPGTGVESVVLIVVTPPEKATLVTWNVIPLKFPDASKIAHQAPGTAHACGLAEVIVRAPLPGCP